MNQFLLLLYYSQVSNLPNWCYIFSFSTLSRNPGNECVLCLLESNLGSWGPALRQEEKKGAMWELNQIIWKSLQIFAFRLSTLVSRPFVLLYFGGEREEAHQKDSFSIATECEPSERTRINLQCWRCDRLRMVQQHTHLGNLISLSRRRREVSHFQRPTPIKKSRKSRVLIHRRLRCSRSLDDCEREIRSTSGSEWAANYVMNAKLVEM